MKIILLGASGMIGHYLIDDLLKEGYEVVAVGRSSNAKPYYSMRGVQYIQVDITKPAEFCRLPQSGISAVVHLAAIMPANMKGYFPQRYFEINTLGTLNVLEFCRKTKVKQIIYTQSHSDMGGYWGKKTIGAYDPYSIIYGNDHTAYIISKIAGLELIKHYHAQHQLSFAVFRCPNIYAHFPTSIYYVNGLPKEIGYRKMIRLAQQSKPLEIWGNSATRKDIVYVKDLNQMICRALYKKIVAGIYNVATGRTTSLEEQVKGIVEVFSPENNPSAIIYRPEIKIKLNNHHYSIKNAIKDLDYKPQYYYKNMLLDMKKEMQSDRFLYMNIK